MPGRPLVARQFPCSKYEGLPDILPKDTGRDGNDKNNRNDRLLIHGTHSGLEMME